MVMNPTADSFGIMQQYDLEPEIFSFKIFMKLIAHLNGSRCKIHLKIDTGMHRLGFAEQDSCGGDSIVERRIVTSKSLQFSATLPAQMKLYMIRSPDNRRRNSNRGQIILLQRLDVNRSITF